MVFEQEDRRRQLIKKTRSTHNTHIKSNMQLSHNRLQENFQRTPEDVSMQKMQLFEQLVEAHCYSY